MQIDTEKNYGIEGENLRQIKVITKRLFQDGDKPLTRGEIRDIAIALDYVLHRHFVEIGDL